MTTNQTSAAVIGLGSMGWGAAVSLLRAGFHTVGVDVRPEISDQFAAEGGIVCQTAAQAAGETDVLFIFVVNQEQTEQVIFGDDGILSTAAEGSVIIPCATTPPAYAATLGKRLSERNMLVIDCPVSGGAVKALAGEMTLMSSGSAAAYSKAEAALNAIASTIYRLGEAPGMGSQVKMINQLLAGVHIATMAEAMTLGIKSGIDPQTLYDVICQSAGNSWMFENRAAHVLAGDYTPRSAVDIFVKDLGIVAAAGEAADFPLPLTHTALDLFKAASAAGLGREDDAAVAKVYAKRGDVELP